MGRTFQRLEAFGSLTVRDNVRVALDIHRGVAGLVSPARSDIDGLLERVGIAAYADDRADSIPTGTARLLELARCLAGDPGSCCSTSRPRASTRPRPTRSASCCASSPPRAAAILMVEHDMDLVMSVCATIYVLDFGEIIARRPGRRSAPTRGCSRPTSATRDDEPADVVAAAPTATRPPGTRPSPIPVVERSPP